MADMQNQQDQVALQRQQAQHEAQIKAAQLASQHLQGMAKINASRRQAMTGLAASPRGDDGARYEGRADCCWRAFAERRSGA